jgi:hypothetical protein
MIPNLPRRIASSSCTRSYPASNPPSPVSNRSEKTNHVRLLVTRVAASHGFFHGIHSATPTTLLQFLLTCNVKVVPIWFSHGSTFRETTATNPVYGMRHRMVSICAAVQAADPILYM